MTVSTAVQAGWTAHQGTAGNTGCILETDQITMHDGYQDTRVRLNINNERLLVITESNIDTGFDDIGLQVDARVTIPADTAVDERNVQFSSATATIIEQFRKGNRVRVYLRFWPSYPATQRYAAVFSLAGFTRAWNEFLSCNS
jgi:hypothetical protein